MESAVARAAEIARPRRHRPSLAGVRVLRPVRELRGARRALRAARAGRRGPGGDDGRRIEDAMARKLASDKILFAAAGRALALRLRHDLQRVRRLGGGERRAAPTATCQADRGARRGRARRVRRLPRSTTAASRAPWVVYGAFGLAWRALRRARSSARRSTTRAAGSPLGPVMLQPSEFLKIGARPRPRVADRAARSRRGGVRSAR